MIVSLIRTVYFLKLKAENTAVTKAGHDIYIYNVFVVFRFKIIS